MRTALLNMIKKLLLGDGYRDRRARIIYRIAGALVVSTALFSWVMWATGFSFADRQGFLEPFYLSWVSGAALLFVSIMIALQQLDTPASENTRRRLEILMQDRDGPAVEYFFSKFHEFEHYAEQFSQKITLEKCNEDKSRVLIKRDVAILLRNFVEDAWGQFEHHLVHETGVQNDGLSLLYFRVDHKPRTVAPFNEEKRSMSYDIRIEPNKAVLVEFGFRHWIGNPHSLPQSVQRFTSKLNLDIENQTDMRASFVSGDDRLELLPSEVRRAKEITDVHPGLAYEGHLTLGD